MKDVDVALIKQSKTCSKIMSFCSVLWASFLVFSTLQSGLANVVRLSDRAGTVSSSKGRLEVYVDGQWGTVCDDDFGQTEADTACREMGFERALYFDKAIILEYAWTDDYLPILLDDLWCDVSDSSLLDCSHSGVGNHDCSVEETVGLSCLTDGSLRIAHDVYGGSYGYGQKERSYGRLEIYMNGDWGTICGNDFGEQEADIACKSLGFEGSSYQAAFFYLGTSLASELTPIWLDSVMCSSEDTSLLTCIYETDGNCTHWKDVGVVCIVDHPGDYFDWIIIGSVVGLLGTIGSAACPVIICACICCAIYSSQQKAAHARGNLGPTVTNAAPNVTVYPVQVQAHPNAPLPANQQQYYPTQPDISQPHSTYNQGSPQGPPPGYVQYPSPAGQTGLYPTQLNTQAPPLQVKQ